jgi:hypothetical protein
MKARLQRLRAEVTSDREAFEKLVEELEALPLDDEPGPGDLARAAVALHHGYGAIEAALARLARTLGEGVPEGEDWHQALLKVMGLAVEGVRPPVLSPETVDGLRRLLGFRHFFRHAYAISLDSERLAALRRDALAVRPRLLADMSRLDAFLADLVEQAPS